MTSLTDRYVWAVVRSIPEKQRADIERELRASIDDAVEARLDSGEDAGTAERETLVGLGDPDRLAADYADRPSFLVGPTHYFDYIRLLKLLYVIVLPIAVVAVALAQFIAGDPVGGIIGGTIAAAISIIVHIGFWTTFVFVLVERTETARKPFTTWTPELLPERTSPRAGLSEFIASAVFLAIFALAIVGQQFYSVFENASGDPIPVLNPDLWSFWLPYFIVVIVLEILFAIVLYRIGRFTWAMAGVNVLLNIAFTVPAIWLLVTQQWLNGEFVERLALDESTNPAVVIPIVAVVFIGVAAWDTIDGFIKARRAVKAA